MKNVKYLLLLLTLCTFNACTNADSCDEIICINGNCNSGACECDEGYTGIDCSDELEPKRIIANQIFHLRSPEFNTDAGGNSISWDSLDGIEADIYVRVYPSSNPNDFKDSEVLIDQVFDQVALFQFIYVFENPKEPYTFEFWDKDTDDTFMTKLTLIPYIPNRGFPPMLNQFLIEGGQSIEMNLSYEF